jgi:transcriptional regulator with XRE-family HTH domain
MATATSVQFQGWLSDQMQRRRMSARELARELGIAPATATEWRYRGRIPVPENCRMLARYFGVGESEVLAIAGWD